jgi:hypothetical protein
MPQEETMADKPNPADFSVNERPREYDIHIYVEGYVVHKIMADSVDEARSEAARMVEAFEDGQEIPEIDDVSRVKLDRVEKTRPLFRVMRDGQKIQVSWLRPGDLPREPDERGF